MMMTATADHLVRRKLLFLPGAVGAASFWRPVGDRLPQEWEKIYMSWPGLGAEPPSAAVQTIDDCVRLVERHLNRPCDLVAQSMGGVVAIRAALRKPAYVRRVVLCATSGGVDVERLGGADWRDGYLQEYPDSARWITGEHADLSDEIKSVTMPTLLIWGDSDPISPVAVGEHLLSLLPDATLRVIEGGSHSFACDEPELTAQLITDHLEAGPRRGERRPTHEAESANASCD